MSVYIDEMVTVIPNKNWKWSTACHLAADSLEELHNFALNLGLKRSWFQPSPGNIPHYDLTKNMRIKAVRMGAIEIDRTQFVGMMQEWRKRTRKM